MTELFNASQYLLDRQLADGHGSRVALSGPGGELTYTELHERVCRTAGALRELGLQPEQRVMLFMADSPELVTVFLAALRMGAIPVPVSTMLHADGLTELLRDSRAKMLAVTREFSGVAAGAIGDAPELRALLVGSGTTFSATPTPNSSVPASNPVPAGIEVHELDRLATWDAEDQVYSTTPDSPGFWLYTSGTTGTPKGAMHRHGAIQVVCETYGQQVLGIRPDDRCLSAAKTFFAYGLGNSVLFPLSVGATSVLEPAPSTAATAASRIRECGVTLFFAGPTFFANMLRAQLPSDTMAGVRLATSAGEPLPTALYHRWTDHFGVDILDGIGMTELLHIFLSNRLGDVHPGTTGVAVPGYDLRVVDDAGTDVAAGTPGTLLVRGTSAATGYWSRYEASRKVFQGEWLVTGDTYVRDEDGYYTCLGRAGDMLKASGMWVSPVEVEARLLAHADVAQAVVVSATDPDGLEKPVAYVVVNPGAEVSEESLIDFCHQGLPSFKRPRRVVFVDSYPTTPTGKIRRVELRAAASAALSEPVRKDGSRSESPQHSPAPKDPAAPQQSPAPKDPVDLQQSPAPNHSEAPDHSEAAVR